MDNGMEIDFNLAVDVGLSGKFVPVVDGDTANFVQSKRNVNTVRKTETDVNTFVKFLSVEKETRELYQIPPEQLNLLLARYFLSVRKNCGDEYEPDTLRGMFSSISRRLQEKDYPHNIITDVLFKHCRDVLHAKKKDLKEKGLGNKKNKAEAYTEEEISILWDKQLLGASNPDSLTNSMWFNNTTHFILRGRQEHNSMLWGDIEMKTTSGGSNFLEFNERATKTRSGATLVPRKFPPKMFAEPGNPRCPVAMYLEYKKRRPAECLDPDSKFYLQVNRTKNPKNPSIWFKDQPMGRDKIGIISKTMSEKAGFQGKKTNHGARRTALVTLTHANIPPNNIVQLSGHRNTLSLNEYSELSIEQQKEMSHMLTHIQKPKCSNETDVLVNNSSSLDVIDDDSLTEVMNTITSMPSDEMGDPTAPMPNAMSAVPCNLPVQVTADSAVNVDSFNSMMPNMTFFLEGLLSAMLIYMQHPTAT